MKQVLLFLIHSSKFNKNDRFVEEVCSTGPLNISGFYFKLLSLTYYAMNTR